LLAADASGRALDARRHAHLQSLDASRTETLLTAMATRHGGP
jgi:hypothetical protein